MSDDPDQICEKPIPPHPMRRRTDLPWQLPKPKHEDPRAPELIAEILKNPNYRQADQDVSFLNEDDTRGVRLQIDYMKAESLLEQYGIKHSIVLSLIHI